MPSQNNQEDFERLCREIAGNVAKGLTTAGNALGDAIGQAVEGYRANQAQAQQRAILAQQQALMETRFGNIGKVKRGGVLRTVFGAILTFSFGIPLLSTILIGPWLVSIPEAIVGTAVMAAFFAPSLALLLSGTKRLKMSRQLDTLQRIFGNREAVPIAEIAHATGQKPAKILSAIQELLRRGMLPQGHLDAEQRTLIVTEGAYQHYLQLKSAQQQKAMEEQKRRQAQAATQPAPLSADDLSPEVRSFVTTGAGFLKQIHQLDVDIADEGVSQRIVHIEGVVGRILERVKDEPQVLSQLGRLTDYYLPTTVKLLTAYDALEEQQVQGENIKSSRREIESTLDVLIQAYEKLLDDTFADLSMDVSSEISVLNVILAQEGLTESPFDSKPEGTINNRKE